ncbi:MAG: HAD family phosphatase [Verrucomicrobia bacterium]|nr:HAD family phosphatase [Verrucomicrobiota bacterium]
MLHDFLFDIGKVILNFDFNLGAQRIQGHCSKVSADEILPAIADLTDDLESGKMDTSSYVTEVSRRLGYSGSEDEFIRAFENIFTPNADMVALIDHLKQNGHRLYLLSNTNGIHVPFFTREYPVFKHFSGAVYSHETGVMKPGAGIYEAAIQQFDLDPHRTIYIDDLEANVIAGRELGLLGIHYDPEQHHRLLENLRALQVQLND